MKKQLQKFFAKKKNNKGFTLIELIIVIAILAILVGIVGMASVRYVEKSRQSADEQTLDSVSTAVQAFIIDPANNVTVKDNTVISVTTAGEVSADPKLEGPSSVDLNQTVQDSLAKTPALKSQKYAVGAKMTITKTGDSDIKVGTWTRGAISVTP